LAKSFTLYKLIILYMLNEVDFPLTNSQISEFILDEGYTTCFKVQQALSALSKGKTVIMIAHRLSSITDADCIYVLQDGEIVESGTHSGLIERNGIFTKMWKDYSEAAEWKIAKEVNA